MPNRVRTEELLAARRNVIAARIRDAREDLGMTQIELAAALDKPRQTVSNWESGHSRPTHENAVELAKVLGKTIEHILALPTPANATAAPEAPASQPQPYHKQLTEDELRNIFNAAKAARMRPIIEINREHMRITFEPDPNAI